MTRAHVDDTPPTDLNLDNGAAITVGNTFRVASNRTIYAIWFWVPTTNTGTYTVGLYDVDDDDAGNAGTGSLLQSATVASGDVIAGQYNRIEITPQAVVTGTFYRTARHASSGRYVRTAGALTAGAISNGGIEIVQSGTAAFDDVVRNGTFNEGAALAYPNQAFGQPDYHVDVDDAPLAGDVVEVAGTLTGTGARAGTLNVDRNLQGNRSGVGSISGSLQQVAGMSGSLNGVGSFASTLSVRSGQPAVPTTNSGGWYGYLNILKNLQEEYRRDASEPPEACPDCGEPLRSGPSGELHCTFDGYIWSGVSSLG